MTPPDESPPSGPLEEPPADEATPGPPSAPSPPRARRASGTRARTAPAEGQPAAAGASAEAPAAKKAARRRSGAKKAAKSVAKKTAAAASPRPARARPEPVHDVVVVGAGPAGASCGFWLADAGWDVVLVEKKVFPREKTCGDGLTPRAVRQLADMGLEGALSGAHRYTGLRAVGFGHTLEMPWPSHPNFPDYGYTITRHDLDGLVAGRAVQAGATLLEGTEVIAPVLDETAPVAGPLPVLRGVEVSEKGASRTRTIRARYVVVADGSNSRVGRMLGTARRRELPMGMALRGYYRSDRHDDPHIESHLDIRDAQGDVVPGYGWIFPMGDGRVNVGVGLLSTEQRWKGLNTTRLMDTFVDYAPVSWGLSPEASLGPPTGGKLPMGLSVGPRAGGNVLVAGDAGGTINPFNGEGITYAYETGRLAAAAVGHALTGEGGAALASYDRELDAAYGPYYKVARAFVHLISHPEAMRLCVGLGMRSELLMNQLLRIMANLMRPDAVGPAELGYRAMELVARMVDFDTPEVPAA